MAKRGSAAQTSARWAGFVEQLGELMDTIQMMMGQTDADREQNDKRFKRLPPPSNGWRKAPRPIQHPSCWNAWREGQEELIKKLDDSGMEGIDAESRMRLRSIDVQLLRILEEMSAGRQESIGDLRARTSPISANAIKDRG